MIVPDWAGYLRFRTQIASVMDPRFYTVEWLDQQILSGAHSLFVGDSAAIVTEIRTYPTWARELHGVVAAGDLAEIRDILIPQALEYGRLFGCVQAVIESREGWGPVLKNMGFEKHQTTFRKAL